MASITPKTLCEYFILYKLCFYNILFKVTPLLSGPLRGLQVASATLDEARFYKPTINQVFLSFTVEYGSSGFALLFIYEYVRIIF